MIHGWIEQPSLQSLLERFVDISLSAGNRVCSVRPHLVPTQQVPFGGFQSNAIFRKPFALSYGVTMPVREEFPICWNTINSSGWTIQWNGCVPVDLQKHQILFIFLNRQRSAPL